ncbi:MAG: ATP-binding protein [Planctomycetes bacterium]|nr:ATP-binding protein [Planctomycetota bacterium]
MESLTRMYTSDLRQVSEIRSFIGDACRRAWPSNADEDAIALLILALAEAATNIILHGYEKRPGEPIEVSAEIDGEVACISLRHRGRDFDPSAVPPPAFDGSRECGFGLHLIRHSVDDVRYFRDEDGQCVVRLVKRRRAP